MYDVMMASEKLKLSQSVSSLTRVQDAGLITHMCERNSAFESLRMHCLILAFQVRYYVLLLEYSREQLKKYSQMLKVYGCIKLILAI